MDTKLAKVYYSPQDYWKGAPSIKKLAEAAKLLEETAKRWFIYCTSVNFTVVLFPFLSSPWGSVYRFLYSFNKNLLSLSHILRCNYRNV